jgi:adenosylmethionine-8-amino-7-oxononanoate aminotransferase
MWLTVTRPFSRLLLLKNWQIGFVLQRAGKCRECSSLVLVSDNRARLTYTDILLTRASGTEAVEAALKMARQYFLEGPTPQPQRTKFIARDKSYHGNTLGALSVGGHQARKAPYLPILSTNVSNVSPCYSYRDQSANESEEDYVDRLAQELEDEFQRQGPDQVCAFIAETVAGTVSNFYEESSTL